MRPEKQGGRRPAARALLVAIFLLGASFVGLAALAPAAQAAAWTGPEPTPTNVTLFLHNSSLGLPIAGGIFSSTVLTTTNDTAVPWAGTGTVDIGVHYVTVPFYLFPRLAGPLQLNGTPTAVVFVNQSGSTTSGAWSLSLYSVSPSGVTTLLGTPGETAYASGYNGNFGLPLRITYGTPLNLTLPAGWSLLASFAQAQGSSADSYGFWWGEVAGSYYASDLNLPVSTYLAVHDTPYLVVNNSVVSSLNTSVASKIVDLRANLTDPLGNYDYANWSVRWSITNGTAVQVASGTMAPFGPNVPPQGAGYFEVYNATYNYSTLPVGDYTLCVNATDNTYHNDFLFSGNYFGRLASGCVGFVVGLPPVTVTVTVVDSHAIPLHGATVKVEMASSIIASNRTDALGVTTLGLPASATYTFSLFWEQVHVGDFEESIGATNVSVTLQADVIYPTFALETSVGLPLPYALVTVVHPNGTELPLTVASSAGEFSLSQVPAGNYTLTVIYDDSEVLAATPVLASNDGPIPVTVPGVFVLTVATNTGGGVALSGVFVSIINSTTGATIASGVSGSSGELIFLVPRGTYTVSGDWVATYDFTSLQQSLTTSVIVDGPSSTTLTFTKAFPAFTSTNEFLFILAFAILAVLIVVLVLLLLARRRKPAPPLTPAPPITGPTKDEGPKSGGH